MDKIPLKELLNSEQNDMLYNYRTLNKISMSQNRVNFPYNVISVLPTYKVVYATVFSNKKVKKGGDDSEYYISDEIDYDNQPAFSSDDLTFNPTGGFSNGGAFVYFI